MKVIDETSTQSREVDHDATSNRKHDGDNISPAELEVTDRFIDPGGDEYTGPVSRSDNRVRELAVGMEGFAPDFGGGS